MDFVQLLEMVGLGELVVDDFFAAQIVVLGITALLFLGSLVLCLQAYRAAGAARRARVEISDDLQTVSVLTGEARRLSADIEYAFNRQPDVDGFIEAPTGPSLEASREPVMDLTERDEAVDARSAKSLDAAKSAATVPSALLRGYSRRR